MLIRFSVKNFKSFKDQVTLDMTKLLRTTKHNHPNHLNKNTKGGFTTLKSAAIFGANASGKTNLIKTMYYLFGWVSGNLAVKTPIAFGSDAKTSNKFLLDSSSLKNEATEFSVEFNTEKKAYCYYVKIFEGIIKEESLKEIFAKGKEILIVDRSYDDSTESYQGNIGKKYKHKELDTIKSAIKISKKDQPLILQLISHSFSKSIKESNFFKDINDTIVWFGSNNLSVLHTAPKYGMTNFFDSNVINLVVSENEFKEFLLELVKKYDIGNISDIITDNLTIPEFCNTPEKSELYDKIIQKITISGSFYAKIGQERFLIGKNKEGEVTIKVIKLVRKNNEGEDVPFSFCIESEGTSKLIDLAVFFFKDSSKNRTIILDEPERSIHPLILKDLIKNILNNDEIENTQLIFTTHSECFFDADLLRRDEIWLVDKDRDGSSKINCLANFDINIRYDKKILGDYLLGRYGGIPQI